MLYPPYCVCCGRKSHWLSDFDTTDYGYENEGIVGVYACSDEDCASITEVIDFFIDGENEDQRVIKYYKENDEKYRNDIEMISSCLYCSSILDEISVLPTTNISGTEFEGITTKLSCSKCNLVYDVVDFYPVDELYTDNKIDLLDTRTIFIDKNNVSY